MSIYKKTIENLITDLKKSDCDLLYLRRIASILLTDYKISNEEKNTLKKELETCRHRLDHDRQDDFYGHGGNCRLDYIDCQHPKIKCEEYSLKKKECK